MLTAIVFCDILCCSVTPLGGSTIYQFLCFSTRWMRRLWVREQEGGFAEWILDTSTHSGTLGPWPQLIKHRVLVWAVIYLLGDLEQATSPTRLPRLTPGSWTWLKPTSSSLLLIPLASPSLWKPTSRKVFRWHHVEFHFASFQTSSCFRICKVRHLGVILSLSFLV